MFRASSAHLQEDMVVYMQHMLPSLTIRVPGGLSIMTGGGRLLVGRLKTPYQQPSPPVSSHSSCVSTGHQELLQRVAVPYAACIQPCPPEDEHLMLETCRGE